jgi:hypothetical protein
MNIITQGILIIAGLFVLFLILNDIGVFLRIFAPKTFKFRVKEIKILNAKGKVLSTKYIIEERVLCFWLQYKQPYLQCDDGRYYVRYHFHEYEHLSLCQSIMILLSDKNISQYEGVNIEIGVHNVSMGAVNFDVIYSFATEFYSTDRMKVCEYIDNQTRNKKVKIVS